MLKRDELANPNSCLNKARDDEPIFVLRAKDVLGPDTVRYWASEALDVHEPEKISEARALAGLMECWHKGYEEERALEREQLARRTNFENHIIRYLQAHGIDESVIEGVRDGDYLLDGPPGGVSRAEFRETLALGALSSDDPNKRDDCTA